MATTTTAPPPPPGDRIIDEPLSEALSRRYLAYALSVITDRALPDVRDGLKPVQRRVLYAMREMRLNPENAARKCAKVVGEVMGGYHPHGDQSIYDTLVRMAQSFAQRYPQVDGQGNFGNIDGDNAAAMRYTEAKLTVAATLLLEGIEEDAVDFKPTYDGSDDEPVVLPAGFPNLLANGSTGIAVGMATSIPPHNAGELIDACLLLLDQPDASTDALMTHVQGPDFPTGGVIVEPRSSLLNTYETGRGGVRVRARWTKEDLGKGTYQIVITEIPYQVRKADLIEGLAELIDAKKAPLLGDVRDESAEDVRVVLEPKSRNVEPEVLMESLFKLSDLETRFSVNLNVLDARGTPGVMGLKQALVAFLDHRREVLVRRARHRLAKIEARLHILDGLLIAYLNLDEVIRIVRYEENPKDKLIETFSLSDLQADAILNTRLRQLARLEEMELRREHAELAEERDGIVSMLANDKAQWKLVGQGLKHTKAKLKDLNVRRSSFADAPQIDTEAALEAMIVREPITIILSERGWIRAAKGRVEDPSELKFKEGDKLQFLVPAETTDKLLIFASDGRFFTLACDKLPGARGHGEPLRLMIDLDDKVGLLDVFPHKPGAKRVLASKAGYGFILPEEEAIAFRRAGKQVLNAGDPSKKGEGAAVCLLLGNADQLAVIGDNGKILVFPTNELPEMPRGKGVKLQSYREGGLRDALAFTETDGMTTVDPSGRTRAWPEWKEWLGKRAGAGKLAPKGFPATKRFRPK
ncbi:MAG: DNA topoisomerase IV subunit A [Alphaproteobacteria bacterium]|nr:DNA topoisomerase IV subunit A [Alphaproteobacteria bacterium]MBU1512911.1 DNA topoisomerase IV subunit A [Alphaproteobacteria bacterium]MBU2096648.1 DNA topoisomerase IV subunit A [Alphaproteobacteria bacterium]MBU2150531.1 DNA topoisomerase IV subunit A [Alphaproteobacteria bacterium]MBU2306540.1 DNA topoisomerase IV subunit A [Alphaproteobacteria bacterium]